MDEHGTPWPAVVCPLSLCLFLIKGIHAEAFSPPGATCPQSLGGVIPKESLIRKLTEARRQADERSLRSWKEIRP